MSDVRAQAGGEGAVMDETSWRDRAAGAALSVADRLQGACFRMTRQRDDDWNWRPTAAQADAVLTSMQLAANEARVVAEIVREHLSDKGD